MLILKNHQRNKKSANAARKGKNKVMEGGLVTGIGERMVLLRFIKRFL